MVLLTNILNFSFIEMKWSDVINFAIKLAAVIIGFIIAAFIIKLLIKGLEKILNKKLVRRPFVGFILSVTRIVLYVVLVLIILGFFNVSTAPLLTVLGTFGLALGLALKDHMSNLASGILIVVNKQFKVGDYIECNNASGVVEKVELFTTKLITIDNKAIFVPNAHFTQNAVTNYTREDIRRVDIAIGVAYSSKVDDVKKAIDNIIKANNAILEEPEYFVGLINFGDNSVNFTVRVWVKTENYWNVYFFINEQIKSEFEKQHIEIPYPQLDVHIDK